MPNNRKNRKTETKSVIKTNKNKFQLLMDSDDDDTLSETESDVLIKEPTQDNTDTITVDNIEDTKKEKQINIKGIYVPPSDRKKKNNDNVWTQNTYKKRYNKKNREIKNVESGEELKYYDNTIDMKGNNMKLNSTWTVWIHENSNTEWDIKSYKSIYNIDNIGSLWRFLSVFDNLDKNVRQYYIMRDGITPIWEDNNNKKGGICSLMFENMNKYRRNSRGDIGVDIFIAICILVLNESFVKNNLDINGLCYSIKNRCVLIKLWIKDYELNTEFIELLPISLLKKIDSLISMMENESNIFRNNGRSRVSVQIKKIQPNY
jgi:hypothetical protein